MKGELGYMLRGIIFSILAGLLISLQGVFNSRLGEKIGFWQTNAFVHITGFILALILLLFFGNFNFTNLKDVNFLYLIGGFIGVVIVLSVMNGITTLGASYAVTIILVTQIFVNFIINKYGIFGEAVIQYSFAQFFGLILMIIGVIIFQLNG